MLRPTMGTALAVMAAFAFATNAQFFSYPNAVDAASAGVGNPQTLLASGDLHATASGPWFPVDVVVPLNMPATSSAGAPTSVMINDNRFANATGSYSGGPFNPVCFLSGTATAAGELDYVLSGSTTAITFSADIPHAHSGTATLAPAELPEVVGGVGSVFAIHNGQSLSGPVTNLKVSVPFTTVVNQWLTLPAGTFTIGKGTAVTGGPNARHIGMLESYWVVWADNGPGMAAGNGLKDPSESTIIARDKLRVDSAGSLIAPANNAMIPAGDYVLEIYVGTRSDLAVTTVGCGTTASGTATVDDSVDITFALTTIPPP